MKKIVVFYSMSGNTKSAAEAIAKEIKADVLEIKPKKEITGKLAKRIFIGGFQAFFKKKPELVELKTKVESYDLIVFGTPIWAGTMSSPMRSLLSTLNLKGKKAALFCSCGSKQAKYFSEFKKMFPESAIVSTLELKEKDSEMLKKARDWAKSLEN